MTTAVNVDVHIKPLILSLISDPSHSDVCTLGFWLLDRNHRISEGDDAIVTNSHSLNVQVEGPHEKIQITNICSLEEFRLIQHG